MPELREGEATWVCPWAWCKRNGGEEWCDKCELRVALAASQEKERQLREALWEVKEKITEVLFDRRDLTYFEAHEIHYQIGRALDSTLEVWS